MVSRVAVIYDMDNIFSWQAQPQSTAFDFSNETHRLYQPFWRNGISIDVFSSERLGEVSLSSNYDVILLPAPLMLSDELYNEIESFVLEKGGSLWVGFRADIKVATNNQMRTDPSRLAALAGVVVNEFESLNIGMPNAQLKMASNSSITASGYVWRDGLKIRNDVSNETESVWDYADPEFFGGLGLSAVTRRQLSNGGEVVYVGTGIDPELLVPLATKTLVRQGLFIPDDVVGPPSVEQIVRNDLLNNSWTIKINYAGESVTVGSLEIPPYGVVVEPTTSSSSLSVNSTIDSATRPKAEGILIMFTSALAIIMFATLLA